MRAVEDLAALVTGRHADRYDELLRDAAGAFSVVSLESTRAVVGCDALGFAFVFHAKNEDIDVFASSAEVAARCIAGAGAAPGKDLLAACWTAYAPYPIGERTGFDGVRLLPEGSVVELEFGREPHFGGVQASWLRFDQLLDESTDALLERIAAAIDDELVATLASSPTRPYMDLTGGKDSRLVLAEALRLGIAREFTLRTVGPPNLRDVEIASDIARHFGLEHETGWPWYGRQAPYRDRVLDFVRATGGMANIWDLKVPRVGHTDVRVSGMTGECLRAHRPIRPVDVTAERVVRMTRASFRNGGLRLLRADAERALDALFVQELLDDPVGGSHPLDLLGTFYVRNRARKFRGPMDQLEADLRSWPLCHPDAVRAAFALTPGPRQDEIVHFELVRRASPALAAFPFAGQGWQPHLAEQLATPLHEVPRAPREHGDPAPVAASKAEPLIARGHRKTIDDRATFLAEVFGSASSSVWELLDRSQVLDALDRIGALSVKQRRQLFGAATAAVWASL